MSGPECRKCGARGYGNCPMSPPCTPHPLGARCNECGVGVTEYGLCPKKPYMQANVGGHGWRQVPNRVRNCINQQESQANLAELIRKSYAKLQHERDHQGQPMTVEDWARKHKCRA